ncbi:MAG: right-handed parallel beta-helix repeat-containing protein [bacterium]
MNNKIKGVLALTVMMIFSFLMVYSVSGAERVEPVLYSENDTDLIYIMPPRGPCIFVNKNSSTPGDGKSWNTAVNSIQQGIDAAHAQGISEIRVASGVYKGNIEMYDDISLYGGFGGTTTIIGQHDVAEYEWCLECTMNYPVVICANNSKISGFVITGGLLERGAGILCSRVNNVRIENTTIHGNVAEIAGGGIYCKDSEDIVIRGNVIRDNRARKYGAGLYVENSSVVIEKNIISNNSIDIAGALYGGGALAISQADDVQVINNLIIDNTAPGMGGGILLIQSSPDIYNNTFDGNDTHIACDDTSSPHIYNCILQGPNALSGPHCSANYSLVDVAMAGKGIGNVTGSADFVDSIEYQLGPESECIDNGKAILAVEDDFFGTPRPQIMSYDIGYHEYVDQTPPEIDLPPIPAMVEANAEGGYLLNPAWLHPTAIDDMEGEVECNVSIVTQDGEYVPVGDNVVLPPGTYTLIFTASDTSGNTAEEIIVIKVMDRTPPTIMAEDEQIIEVACGIKFIAYDDIVASLTARAEDIYGIEGELSIDAPDRVAVGDTVTVTIMAEDSSGNVATKDVKVTVKEADSVAPVIELDKASPITVNKGQKITVNAKVTDQCDSNPSIVWIEGETNIQEGKTLTYDTGSVSTGEHEIILKATDKSGNQSIATLIISVGAAVPGQTPPFGSGWFWPTTTSPVQGTFLPWQTTIGATIGTSPSAPLTTAWTTQRSSWDWQVPATGIGQTFIWPW